MTSKQENYSQVFEYARGKAENGEWSWEQAFEYAAKCMAESSGWNWEQAFEWCKHTCEAFFKKEAKI